ncbi:MAG: MBL-fold metallo-hydrolase superfamily [uncultured Friedmanniella sp.]|uniref:MBL-fold metallo-hydrolase superfamily n=1 Tax=uncultured Friedmanniella sp. TaxID=335381 RepID=A0A6J4KET0_9ACTN|nr:MAG: MBL-fold metallo-hydrolase superfamily [uncultured Friedmanniella sp.]
MSAVEVVAPYLRRLLAPNPGPMTLEGTNTWLLGDPAAGPVVVVDPGPDDAGHRDRMLAAAPAGVGAVLLTHRHADHSAGAPALAARAGCPVRALDPAFRVGEEALAEDDGPVVAGARLRVVATPGHTADSCSVLLHGDDGVVWLLTGDTVLGRGTTVIAAPDGDLGAYLGSLDRLAALVAAEGVAELLPGHGPRVGDPGERLAAYRQHREERLEQVRVALREGARGVQQVADRVYGDLGAGVRPAAEQSVRAQLRHLGAAAAED